MFSGSGKIMKEAEILRLIRLIRMSHKTVSQVYTQGACYQFYKILKTVVPSAKPFYNDAHVITKIGNKFYDIDGEYDPSIMSKRRFLEMDAIEMEKAEDWCDAKFNFNYK